MDKKILCAMLFAAFMGTNSVIADTIQYRVENMRCGGCAKRVKTALTAKPGVDKVSVDMEKKVVTISFDADKISTKALASTITAAKFTPTAYSKSDVIERVASYKAVQMHCGGCAKRVKTNIGAVEGVKSIETNLDTKEVKITYDANKVSKSVFKDAFKKFDFTVSTYLPNAVFAYTQVNVTKGDLSAAAAEKLSNVKGFVDVTLNDKTKTIAITYNSKVMDEAGVKNQLKNLKYTIAD